jgi:hypothetical protein
VLGARRLTRCPCNLETSAPPKVIAKWPGAVPAGWRTELMPIRRSSAAGLAGLAGSLRAVGSATLPAPVYPTQASAEACQWPRASPGCSNAGCCWWRHASGAPRQRAPRVGRTIPASSARWHRQVGAMGPAGRHCTMTCSGQSAQCGRSLPAPEPVGSAALPLRRPRATASLQAKGPSMLAALEPRKRRAGPVLVLLRPAPSGRSH